MPQSSLSANTSNVSYRRWAEKKRADIPTGIDDLVVEIANATAPSPAEIAALRERVARFNVAVYVTSAGDDPDPSIPRNIMTALGVSRFDVNPEATEEGVTSLTPKGPHELAGSTEYIPYSNYAINWHTDGYYNDKAHRIRSLALHCVRPGETGGENDLLNHELAYIHLRDTDPALASALFAPHVMTIPFREENGVVVRPDRQGPVFFEEAGAIHMRYTHRTRSVIWKDDPTTTKAVTTLREYLDGDPLGKVTGRLASGWGLVCNNILHTRSAFTGDDRLLYRIRYYDAIL